MRVASIVALLFSVAVFAAPMQDMEDSQEVTEYADIPEFADVAEFADWLNTADLENMENGRILDAIKKGVKTVGKVGKAILQNGPQILDTASAIKKTVKGSKGAQAPPAAEEPPAQ